MKWNWQQADWRTFSYDVPDLSQAEHQFATASAFWQGQFSVLSGASQHELTIGLLEKEAIQTSLIEGEILDRESVQASLRRLFGLSATRRSVGQQEYGISELMVDVFRNYQAPITHERLFEWHRMLTNGRRDLQDIGRYRTFDEPMQIVSGPVSRPKVHFEAPPSNRVHEEMTYFLGWLQETGPDGSDSLPPITRAGIAHLWFESVHPFEDGNGRIGRAISEKLLAEGVGRPGLILLADAIERQKKAYYEQLERASQTNDVSEWLAWFSEIVLEAQSFTQHRLDLLLKKIRLMDRLHGVLNQRQEKVLLRLFEAGPEGFAGGLSARNYRSITGSSEATATRDLQQLVEWEALTKTGEKKGTRYFLA